MVLDAHGLLEGVKATCHPSKGLKDESEKENRVVVSNKFITSRSPGTAMEFALEIVGQLLGEEKKAALAAALLFK